MERILFSFASPERSHVVQKEIRAAGFKTINTSDARGYYVSVLTGEVNRPAVEALREKALESLES